MAYELLFGKSEFLNLITQSTQTKVNNGNLLTSFTTSLFAILATQVGDKTFFLAMIMAMKYNKIVVFSGAFAALAVMTVVSAVSGKVIFSFLPQIYTDIAVTILFFYFGGKLIYQAYTNQQTQENEELKQVQIQLKQMEEKLIRQSQSKADSSEKGQQPIKIQNIMTNKIIFTQAFIMTFLAQWGDRSQVATIALAISYNLVMVNIGAMLGHFICTGGAVNLGEWISKRVSQKCVHYVGGVVFIISGIITFFMIFQHV